MKKTPFSGAAPITNAASRVKDQKEHDHDDGPVIRWVRSVHVPLGGRAVLLDCCAAPCFSAAIADDGIGEVFAGYLASQRATLVQAITMSHWIKSLVTSISSLRTQWL